MERIPLHSAILPQELVSFAADIRVVIQIRPLCVTTLIMAANLQVPIILLDEDRYYESNVPDVPSKGLKPKLLMIWSPAYSAHHVFYGSCITYNSGEFLLIVAKYY